ncbi:accessory Sec system protein Asp2 [Streptococcus sp. NLN64]|uniref:accessory Sec system protein Asp2 n=1 Tax=Streptococcus sp. NLN64 TaxID=2822799 RepID=UPI0018C9BDAA|nr:accessory Sec system protein Asp2 [Streptococcus sp. NLN64]MBG9366824.1 accessory Sec system protein Asp2 [Streptococcus sp. NLN64]
MKVLQIGSQSWAESLEQVPEDLDWYWTPTQEISDFIEVLTETERAKLPVPEEGQPQPKLRLRFDVILITEGLAEKDLEPLVNMVEPYGLYVDKGIKLEAGEPYGMFRRKILRELDVEGDSKAKMDFLQLTHFESQYGAKLKLPDIDINQDFQGDVFYDGHVAVHLKGDFGQDFRPLLTFRYNLGTFPVALEIWLEHFKVSGNPEIQLELTPMQKGSLYRFMEPTVLTEEQLKEPYVLPRNEEIGFYTVSVWAKGQGELGFGPLHWRYSRIGMGRFVLGGKRYSDEKKQEFIYYFNPGDMKPPMNVYFSGFRPAEGFEGYGIMKSLKRPFMLIGDPRLEGGGFYIGSPELEAKVVEVIQESLDYLGFDKSDLILSGLSMGTFGALYYAADFDPYAVVIGKPFTNVGDTVAAMKLKRPDEFETSADVLRNVTGGTDEESIQQLNQRFWDKFNQSSFDQTTFAIAYMENDDYDGQATARLIEALSDKKAHIYAKGYEGRHNDNSRAINKWFKRQYVQLLEDGYGRKYG